MSTNFLDSIYRDIQQKSVEDYPINDEILNMHKEPLYQYIDDIMHTVETIPGVKYNGYELITDERKFDPYKVDERHRKSKKKKVPIMPIDKSRYELMRFKFSLRCVNKKNEIETSEVVSELLLPKRVDGFYYQKNGNRFYPIFQVCENSTYNRPNSVTFKTGYNAIIVSRKVKTIEDTEGNIYKGNQMLLSFTDKPVPIPYIFMSIFSIKEYVKFFFKGNGDLLRLIRAEDVTGLPPKGRVYIKMNKFIYCDVDKYAINNLQFMIDFVLIMKTAIAPKTEFDHILGTRANLIKLGSRFNLNKNNQEFKGNNVLKSFSKALDEVVKRNNKLPYEEKKTTFHLLRNIVQNYDSYREKNNLDLENKRIRLNEHLIYHLNEILSKHCNRLLNKKDITLKNLTELVSFRRTELVTSIQKARLTRNDNMVNDMSVLTLTEYSIKGPNAMAYMEDCYRALDPSYVGYMNLLDTSSSDPGLAGSLVPFANIKKGGFFSDNDEPNHYRDIMIKSGMNIYPFKREVITKTISRDSTYKGGYNER